MLCRRPPIGSGGSPPTSPSPGDSAVPTLHMNMQDTFSEADGQLAELQMKLEQLKSARDSMAFGSSTMSVSNNNFAMTRSLNFPSDEPVSGERSFSLR